jgi:DNA-binding CsgD family transcriptional regulator
MAGTEGYHRTPMRRRLNARQRQVLDALIDGKTNPQIAAQLGITLDGAKWHVSQLLAETDLSTREELAQWWSVQRSKTTALLPFGLTWTRLVAGATFAAAIGLVLLLAVALPHYRKDRTAALAELVVSPTPETASSAASDAPDCNVDLPADFRIVTAAELRQQGLVEIGKVIDTQDCPLKVSNRVDRAFIWIGGSATIEMNSVPLHQVTRFGAFGGSNCFECDLGFYYNGEQFMLPLASVQPDRAVGSASSRLPLQGAFNKVDGIALSGGGRDGLYRTFTAKGEESGYHAVALTSEGVVFLNPAPITSSSSAVDATTGMEIDTTRMQRIGSLGHPNEPYMGAASVSRIIDWCFGQYACSLYYRGEPFPLVAPVDGTIRCLPPGVPAHPATGEIIIYELVATSFTLRIQEERPREPSECHSGLVRQGQEISPAGIFTISAFDEDGLLTSIVATEDGTLYVGDVPPFAFRCPCSNGN